MTAALALLPASLTAPVGTTLTTAMPQGTDLGQNPFAALLAAFGMMQPVPQQTTPVTTQNPEQTAFGRPFNFDPLALVTLDGLPVDNTFIPAENQSSVFPADLLAALTPGIPTPIAQPPAAHDTLAQTGAILSALPPVQSPAQHAIPQSVIAEPLAVQNVTPLLTATGLTIPDMAAVMDQAAPVSIPVVVKTGDSPPVQAQHPAVISVAMTTPAAPKDKPATPSTHAPVSSPQKWFEGESAALWQFNSDGATPPRPVTPPHTPLSHAAVIVAQAGNGNAAEHSALLSKGQTNPADMAAGLASVTPGALMDGESLLLTSATSILPAGLHNTTLTQTPAATALHPATGVVAANLQAVATGLDKTKSFSLTLTPAELGRVQVDMKLDAAKKMKVVLTVEKETTFHLLQRDATALQSILDKTSHTADISFELASDQHNFDGTQDQRQAFAEMAAPPSGPRIRLDAPTTHTGVGAAEGSVPPGRVNKLV